MDSLLKYIITSMDSSLLFFSVEQLMRECCEDVARYGDTACPTNVRPRHVTVILNPAAKKRLSQSFQH